MTEYAMAKAAGEALCSDMNLSFAPMHVTQSRLPRLLTDQTASVADVETADPVEILLPIIREVQSWPKCARPLAGRPRAPPRVMLEPLNCACVDVGNFKSEWSVLIVFIHLTT